MGPSLTENTVCDCGPSQRCLQAGYLDCVLWVRGCSSLHYTLHSPVSTGTQRVTVTSVVDDGPSRIRVRRRGSPRATGAGRLPTGPTPEWSLLERLHADVSRGEVQDVVAQPLGTLHRVQGCRVRWATGLSLSVVAPPEDRGWNGLGAGSLGSPSPEVQVKPLVHGPGTGHRRGGREEVL